MTLIDDRPTSRRRPARTAPTTSPGKKAGSGKNKASGTKSKASGRNASGAGKKNAGAATVERRKAQPTAPARQRLSRTEGRPAPTTPSGVFTGLAQVPFIVPIVVLVIAALGFTLYLSTKSAQDSYALESLRKENQILTEQRNDLKRTADSGDSAPELADKATRQLGMIPATAAAHLVVGADGKARLQGELTAAEGRRIGSLNPAPDPVSQIDVSKVDDSGGLGGTPPPAAADEPAGQNPSGQDPAGTADGAGPEDSLPSLTVPGEALPKPEPNVLPQRGTATPGRNTPSGR